MEVNQMSCVSPEENESGPETVAERQEVVLIKYPSVACRMIGKALGCLYESISWPRINGIKPSYLLFTLPTALLPAIGYFELKLFGDKYVLTNRAVQRRKALGNQLVSQVSLFDIAEITVVQGCGQVFYKAADLHLMSDQGVVLMRLEGVVRAEVFRRNILEARDAIIEVESSLKAIQARQVC